MKKIFVASLCLIHFTCYKTDVIQHGTANLDPRQWASGGQITSLSQQYNVFCGGVKTCKFLYKYDDSMWADTDNYYSEFKYYDAPYEEFGMGATEILLRG